MVVPQLQGDKKTPSLENLTIFKRSPSIALTAQKGSEEPPAKLPGEAFEPKVETLKPNQVTKPNEVITPLEVCPPVPPAPKKPKLSVADASACILGKMEAAGEEKKKKKAGDKPGAKKMADNKVRVRYEHVAAENKYVTYYNKLQIKVWGFHGETRAWSGPPTLSLSGPSTAGPPSLSGASTAQRCLYRSPPRHPKGIGLQQEGQE